MGHRRSRSASILPMTGSWTSRRGPRARACSPARMWRGIVFVGIIMAVGTLFVLDASMPGGFVEGSGTCRMPRRWRSRR